MVSRNEHDVEERSLRSALLASARDLRGIHRDLAIIVLATAVLCVAAYYVGSRRFYAERFFDPAADGTLFTLHQHLYWFVSYFILYLLIPLLLVRCVHKGHARAWGFAVGDWRFGLKAAGLTLAAMLPLLWFASSLPEFRAVYPHAAVVRDHWDLLLLYEGAFLLYFLGWEYIWRGYMLFGLTPLLGKGGAILLQMLPFVLLHLGKPPLETIGAIPAALLLGALALRTRSYLYGVLIHWVVMGLIDLLATLRYRGGIEGAGIEALRGVVAYLLG